MADFSLPVNIPSAIPDVSTPKLDRDLARAHIISHGRVIDNILSTIQSDVRNRLIPSTEVLTGLYQQIANPIMQGLESARMTDYDSRSNILNILRPELALNKLIADQYISPSKVVCPDGFVYDPAQGICVPCNSVWQLAWICQPGMNCTTTNCDCPTPEHLQYWQDNGWTLAGLYPSQDACKAAAAALEAQNPCANAYPNPNTQCPGACPPGQHWDSNIGKCVDDVIGGGNISDCIKWILSALPEIGFIGNSPLGAPPQGCCPHQGSVYSFTTIRPKVLPADPSLIASILSQGWVAKPPDAYFKAFNFPTIDVPNGFLRIDPSRLYCCDDQGVLWVGPPALGTTTLQEAMPPCASTPPTGGACCPADPQLIKAIKDLCDCLKASQDCGLDNESAWAYKDCDGTFGDNLDTWSGDLKPIISSPKSLSDVATIAASGVPDISQSDLHGPSPW